MPGQPPASESSWNQRESIILDFESVWQSTKRSPGIAPFTDRMPGSKTLLLELIKIDLEYHWKNGIERRVEDYTDLSPDLLHESSIRRELLEEELLARQAVQKAPKHQELIERFPRDEAWLEEMVDEFAIRSESILADRSVEIFPGQRVGRYEMIEVAGQGAFADVWRANDTDLQREVAIKVLRMSKSESSGVFGRFIREARTAANLSHPAIVPVYEINQSGNRPYIVSQFVDGPTLEQLSQQPMSFAESARIVAELARGLACVHELGIVHRDLKPANVLIGDGNQPMITDFGLAHVEQHLEATLTQQGDVLGTPAYMAPEQARGDVRRIDSRTDVYALGVVLYRLASGRLPFEGTTSTVLYGVIHNLPTPIESVAGAVPPDFKTMVNKCLEKSPADRYQSASQLADELDRFLRGDPIEARAIGTGERLWRWTQRRPKLAAVLATCLLLASFCLGTLGQLQTVRHQRNQTQALLAQSAQDAGHLAMQAGHYREAIEHFMRSFEGSNNQSNELAFDVVEAMVANRQPERAAKYLRTLTNENASRAFEAKRLLWEAELGLENALPDVDVVQTLRDSRAQEGLPADEDCYVQALLASTTSESIEKYESCLNENPFHDRARRKLIASLLAAAEFDRAKGITSASHQLYPTNASYAAIDALAMSITGNLDLARANINASTLTTREKQEWMSLCELSLQTHVGVAPAINNDVYGMTREVVHQFSQACFPLMSQHGFLVSPKIQAKMRNLLKVVDSVPRDLAVVDTRISDLLESHPEGTLYQCRAELALAKNDWDSALQFAKAAQQLPSILKSTRSESGKTIAAIATYHLSHGTKEKERYTQLLNDSIESIDMTGLRGKQIRVFVVGAMRAGNYEKAHEIAAKYWDDSENALWHRSIIARDLKRYEEAISLAERLLKLNPGNKQYQGLRNSIVRRVRESVEAYNTQDTNPERKQTLFTRENIVAWCIVPFDGKKRSPAQRAEMIKDLGLKRVAYDWREEHVASFEEEILQYKKHGIEYFAFWGVHDTALELFRKHELHPQIWMMLPQPAADSESDRIAEASEKLLPTLKRLNELGCKLGIYNHGGWSGEPANMVAICEHLQKHHEMQNVGIVYNLHHGHEHLDGFAKNLTQMKPHLLCINLNGMSADADEIGRKILPLGHGEMDVELLRTIQESGYQGPVGIIGHTQDDVEQRLLDNLDGLDWILPQLAGKPASPRPELRIPLPPR